MDLLSLRKKVSATLRQSFCCLFSPTWMLWLLNVRLVSLWGFKGKCSEERLLNFLHFNFFLSTSRTWTADWSVWSTLPLWCCLWKATLISPNVVCAIALLAFGAVSFILYNSASVCFVRVFLLNPPPKKKEKKRRKKEHLLIFQNINGCFYCWQHCLGWNSVCVCVFREGFLVLISVYSAVSLTLVRE